MKFEDLSAQSKYIFNLIADYNDNWEPCFVEDLAEDTGLSVNQIKGHITDLRNKGYLEPLDKDCLELFAK